MEEVEEKVKEEEKDAEKEKERKEVKARKEKERAKAKERKEKENALEGQCVVFVIRKDTGEMNAPTDIQYEMLKQENKHQEQKPTRSTHRTRISIRDRMLSNLEVSDRPQVDRTQES